MATATVGLRLCRGVWLALAVLAFAPLAAAQRVDDAAPIASPGPEESAREAHDEAARLDALDAQLDVASARLDLTAARIVTEREAAQAWSRRARAVRADELDRFDDRLREALGAAQDALSRALEAQRDGRSTLPPSPLDASPDEALPAALRDRRATAARRWQRLRDREHALRLALTAARFDAAATLHRARLGLAARLPAARRTQRVALSPEGWSQAALEARQLSLVLRHHLGVAREARTTLAARGLRASLSWPLVRGVSLWALLVAAFVALRRRTRSLLRLADARLALADRHARRPGPSASRRMLRVLYRVHRSLEWAAFAGVSWAMLPATVRGLVEVRVLGLGVAWLLGSALVVHALNALAGARRAVLGHDDSPVERLRLDSLRLVGRAVVAVAMGRSVCAHLVGEGTIFVWVTLLYWAAALPLAVWLLRAWRAPVFARLERRGDRSPLQSWALAHRTGWRSVVAALLGVLHLLFAAVVRLLRRWLSAFDLPRRIHAYLFRREIERLGESGAGEALRPLDDAALTALHPERTFAAWTDCPASAHVDDVIARVSQGRCGVVALVGVRGMGKSSLLRVLSQRVQGAVLLACDAATGPEAVRAAWANGGEAPRLVMLDDTQKLLKPVIGGLAAFDEMVALARSRGEATTWVLAIDAAVWPLLKRARDARPLFDEVFILAPWEETQIAALIAERTAAAGLSPVFDDLVEALPPGADAVDREDALVETRRGYERMLWDHADGNPAIALEVWRASLGRDAADAVHVRPLQVPDAAVLDALPDVSLFILRAVYQLTPASVDDVARATRLRPEEVLHDVRYGQRQGFFVEQGGRVCISWPWLRPVTQLLERRHLLVVP